MRVIPEAFLSAPLPHHTFNPSLIHPQAAKKPRYTAEWDVGDKEEKPEESIKSDEPPKVGVGGKGRWVKALATKNLANRHMSVH